MLCGHAAFDWRWVRCLGRKVLEPSWVELPDLACSRAGPHALVAAVREPAAVGLDGPDGLFRVLAKRAGLRARGMAL